MPFIDSKITLKLSAEYPILSIINILYLQKYLILQLIIGLDVL